MDSGPSTSYAFSNQDPRAPAQLSTLEELLDPLTRQHLETLRLPAAARCWEVGAGGGSIARTLARAVVPEGGSVLATDRDTSRLTGADGMTVRRHDVSQEPPPGGEFDLVHARLLLLHVPKRERVLRELAGALRPGGTLLVEEWDCTVPPRALAAPTPDGQRLFDRTVDGVLSSLRSRGASLEWAREVPAAMRGCGLTHVRTMRHTETWHGGGAGCRLHRINAGQLAADLGAHSGLTEGELSRFAELTEDPALHTSSYRFLSTSGVARTA